MALVTLNNASPSVNEVELAPDTTYPSDKTGANNPRQITGIDGSSGLTTALSLSGKWAISYLAFSGMSVETVTVKLTIDGRVIWNDSFSNTITGVSSFLGDNTTAGQAYVSDISIVCKSSFLLEIATTADANVTLQYLARPVL